MSSNTKNPSFVGLLSLGSLLRSLSTGERKPWAEEPVELHNQAREAILTGELEPTPDCDCEFCAWIVEQSEWTQIQSIKGAVSRGPSPFVTAGIIFAPDPSDNGASAGGYTGNVTNQPGGVYSAEAAGEFDPYAELKFKHARGASIYGIAKDGSIHYIKEPKWECPPERYVYTLPEDAVVDLPRDVPSILREAAGQYEVKNPLYGDAYKAYGPTMLTFFPQGLFINEESDWVRFGLFSMMVSKMNRIAANLATGGHRDSALDLATYAAMMVEQTEEK